MGNVTLEFSGRACVYLRFNVCGRAARECDRYSNNKGARAYLLHSRFTLVFHSRPAISPYYSPALESPRPEQTSRKLPRLVRRIHKHHAVTDRMHEPEKSTVFPRHFSFIISHGEEGGGRSLSTLSTITGTRVFQNGIRRVKRYLRLLSSHTVPSTIARKVPRMGRKSLCSARQRNVFLEHYLRNDFASGEKEICWKLREM